MKQKLLVDYLEESAEYLAGKNKALRELNRQYKEVYDKQIREEMDVVKKEIGKKREEIIETVYENLEEMRYLKKYFAELLQVFLEDENIGDILSKKSFLFENSRQMDDREALNKLNEIKKKRSQLRDAKKFLHDWTGTISGRKLGATYPVLKGKIEGNADKEDAIEVIKKMNSKLRKKGWMIIINSPLAVVPLQRYMNRKKMLEVAEIEAKRAYANSKGKGTSAEYDAKKKLDETVKEKNHVEKMIKHVLLANPELLSSLKKAQGWKRGKKDPLQLLAESIPMNKIREKTWMDQMRKKLS